MMRVFLFLTFLMFGTLSDARAQSGPFAPFTPTPGAPSAIANNSCDSAYMNALNARAWMEAEREIVQNQNLIYKPDSVLEYTCFNDFARAVDGSFSGAVDVSNVTDRTDNYLEQNFEHTLLGGRSTSRSLCGNMANIWNAAKCTNFFARTEDAFLDFDFYQTADIRNLPRECSNEPDSRWENYRQTAANTIDDGFDFDNINLYSDLMATNSCDLAISTGAFTTGNPAGVAATPYYYGPDVICIAPGCRPKSNQAACERVN